MRSTSAVTAGIDAVSHGSNRQERSGARQGRGSRVSPGVPPAVRQRRATREQGRGAGVRRSVHTYCAQASCAGERSSSSASADDWLA